MKRNNELFLLITFFKNEPVIFFAVNLHTEISHTKQIIHPKMKIFPIIFQHASVRSLKNC